MRCGSIPYRTIPHLGQLWWGKVWARMHGYSLIVVVEESKTLPKSLGVE